MDAPILTNEVAVDRWLLKRFRAALAAFCGGRKPPRKLARAWLVKGEDAEALFDWVLTHSTLPWAYGITQVEAAEDIAREVEHDRAARHRMGPKEWRDDGRRH